MCLHAYRCPWRSRPEEKVGSPELELQVVVIHAETQSWVLWKSRECSLTVEPSLLQPLCLFIKGYFIVLTCPHTLLLICIFHSYLNNWRKWIQEQKRIMNIVTVVCGYSTEPFLLVIMLVCYFWNWEFNGKP